MSKRMLIDASHPEETRVVIVDGTKIEELDFESASAKQLRGNLYLARVTRVEPSLQAAFVEYGGNRHGFLAFSEIHPDYYQIPYEDRIALLEAEEAETLEEEAEEEEAVVKTSKKKSSKKKTSKKDDESEDNSESSEVKTDAEDSETSVEGVDDITEDADEDVADEQEKTAQKRRSRSSRHKYKMQEVIKRGQILLIQVVKEERGNKGAAMTTYLSLAGRYCVLMPNTPKGGGISRKIANGADRKRLKSVVSEFEVPQGMGVIVRTAGAKRTKSEVKRDYDYLSRLWETIRDTTLKSIAPALIHEEGNLVKRSIRDLYNKDIEEILVQGDDAYKNAKDFIKMLMPSHAKNVKAYKEPIPLFLRYQVESQIEDSLDSVVQLKSGGYLVIHPTEALVSVDVNSGRSTKERNVERTALKTNLEAADEVARQMRMRDLAGLVVIDFIDMDEHRNNRAVEKRMKDALARDRARVQAGRISQFGLMEISRQRRRRSLLEGSTIDCPHCQGVGRKRTVDSAALKALRALEEKAARGQTAKARLTVAPEVAAFILNFKRDELNRLQSDFNMYAVIESDPDLFLPEYALTELEKMPGKNVDSIAEIEKELKQAAREAEKTRSRKKPSKTSDDDEDDNEAKENNGEDREERDETDGKKRRRRGRRGGRRRRGEKPKDQEASEETSETGTESESKSETEDKSKSSDKDGDKTEDKPKRTRTRRSRSSKKPSDEASDTADSEKTETAKVDTDEKPKAKRRTRRKPAKADKPAEVVEKVVPIAKEKPVEEKPKSTTRKKAPARKAPAEKPDAKAKTKSKAETPPKEDVLPEEKPKAKRTRTAPKKAAKAEPVVKSAEPVAKAPEPTEKKTEKPKKSGWWAKRLKKD